MSSGRYKPLKYILAALLLLVVGAASFLKGYEHAAQSMRIVTATPDEIANDMQQDDFYSTYGERTLMIQAIVSSVATEDGGTVIQLQTSSTYSAYCDIGNTVFTGKAGDTITILAEGGPAERQAAAVLLTGCVVL